MTPELPAVSVEREAGLPVVRLNGEIDHANAGPITAQVLDGVRGSAAAVLDLSAVTYLDSAGIRLVDRVAAAFGRGPEPRLRVVAPDPSPARFTLLLCAFPAVLLRTGVEQAVADLV